MLLAFRLRQRLKQLVLRVHQVWAEPEPAFTAGVPEPLELFEPEPAEVEGWQALVAEVNAAGGAYVQHVDVGNGQTSQLGAAPMEWSLLAVVDGRIRPQSAVCVVTGQPIEASTPRKPDGSPDWSHFGVRCCRCRRPIHIQVSGMTMPYDAPSCPGCRSKVKALVS